jgi:hypothetical protein
VFFYSIKNFNSKFLLKFEINLRFKYWAEILILLIFIEIMKRFTISFIIHFLKVWKYENNFNSSKSNLTITLRLVNIVVNVLGDKQQQSENLKQRNRVIWDSNSRQNTILFVLRQLLSFLENI